VRAVHTPPPECVAAQIDTLFEDVRVEAVKIGMLADAATVRAVADSLRRHRPVPVVLDPVMVAAGGDREVTQFVELDGCFNFRDLGGYRTEDSATVGLGRLYRSDSLHRLTPAGRAAFDELGVVTVLDLRTAGEVAEHAWVPSAQWPGRWQHVPLLDSTPDCSAADPAELDHPHFVVEYYRQVVAAGAAGLRSAVATLAEPGALPAVFHCAAGKDRTGVLAALVLWLLHVPVETVADDYALSEEATARWEASLDHDHPDDTQASWSYVPPSLLRCERGTMLTFLHQVDAEYGSVEGFTAWLGIDTRMIDRLRAAVLV
jgi:protein-tyrosine phosphatase